MTRFYALDPDRTYQEAVKILARDFTVTSIDAQVAYFACARHCQDLKKLLSKEQPDKPEPDPCAA